MNIFSYIFLGIIQGLTEFLPVSSSGHLVLIQKFIPNFSQPGVLFDVVLHLGTLSAVLFYFRTKILKLSFKYCLFLIVGTIPAALVGFFFRTQIEELFTSYKIVGFALLVTGVLNFFTDEVRKQGKKLSFKSSIVTGIAQAIAIIPGVSRSGSTIFASVSQGIDKKTSAQFSFLLSIPAVLGANILEIAAYSSNGINDFLPAYLIGFVFSLISGFLAIKLVFKFLSEGRFKIFAFYCFLIGVLAIIF